MDYETYQIWKKLMILCRNKRNGKNIPFSKIKTLENELIKRGLTKNETV